MAEISFSPLSHCARDHGREGRGTGAATRRLLESRCAGIVAVDHAVAVVVVIRHCHCPRNASLLSERNNRNPVRDWTVGVQGQRFISSERAVPERQPSGCLFITTARQEIELRAWIIHVIMYSLATQAVAASAPRWRVEVERVCGVGRDVDGPLVRSYHPSPPSRPACTSRGNSTSLDEVYSRFN
jgi:hypothetical protein